MAATLGPVSDSAVSHTTAARFSDSTTSEPTLHLSVPRAVRSANRIAPSSTVSIRSPARYRALVDGIPCTSATRTIDRLRGGGRRRGARGGVRIGTTHGAHFAAGVRAAGGGTCAVAEDPARIAVRETRSRDQRPGDPALQYRLEVKIARLLRTSQLPAARRASSLSGGTESTSPSSRCASAWSARGSSTTGTDFSGSETSVARPGSRRRVGAWCSSAGTTSRSGRRETLDRIRYALS